MVSALHRKLLRDLWRLRGQAVAAALVIGSGLAVLTMSLGTITSLEETREAFYERYRFAHVFAALVRAPERVAEAAGRLPGVMVAESRIVEPALLALPGLAEPAAARLVSLPEHGGTPRLNDLALRAGRWPEPDRPDEALVNEAFAEANGFHPGDHFAAVLDGHRRRIEIVGVALSPEYVYVLAPGGLMPDDRRFGIIWMGRKALAAAYDLDGAFNDLSLTVSRGADLDQILTGLDALLAPYGGTGAVPRRDQISNWFLNGEVRKLGQLARVVPTIFLAVAAFLLNVSASRLVATQQAEIGLLKAFGYGNGAVGRHFLGLVLAMAAPGIGLGCLAGSLLGRGMTEMYARFYRFPFLLYRPDSKDYAVAVAVGVLAALVGALAAVHRAVRLEPAQAMVPPPPPSYRRGPLAGRGPAIDQPSLMILRHLGRWPVRTALTTTGIAMAMAVLVFSLQFLDSIELLMDAQFFRGQRQDATIAFADARSLTALAGVAHLPGVLAVEPFRGVPVRLGFGPRSRREVITGMRADSRLGLLLDTAGRQVILPARGLVLSTKLADLLGAGRGDVVRVEVLDGKRPVLELPVTGLVETWLGTPAYMDLDALAAALREAPTASGAWATLDSAAASRLYQRLTEVPEVAGLVLRGTLVASFRATLAKSMHIVLSFYVMFGAFLTFGVVYNGARIALSERRHELATLRVLGFTRGEVSYILLGELAAQTIAALPMGAGFGWGLAHMLAASFDTEQFRMPVSVSAATMGQAALVVVVSAVLSGLLVQRKIRGLDLVAVLKARE